MLAVKLIAKYVSSPAASAVGNSPSSVKAESETEISEINRESVPVFEMSIVSFTISPMRCVPKSISLEDNAIYAPLSLTFRVTGKFIEGKKEGEGVMVYSDG